MSKFESVMAVVMAFQFSMSTIRTDDAYGAVFSPLAMFQYSMSTIRTGIQSDNLIKSGGFQYSMSTIRTRHLSLCTQLRLKSFNTP